MVSVGEKTIYKNIYKFLPGQKIEFDLNKFELSKSFFKHHLVKNEENAHSYNLFSHHCFFSSF